MKRFPWVSWWLELWLEIAWFPLLVVFLIVMPFRPVLITLGETAQLSLISWFILQGILLGGVLSLWVAVREARKRRLGKLNQKKEGGQR